MPTRESLDNFLSSITTRRDVLENVDVTAPTQEELTEEENQELIRQAMSNLGLATSTTIEVSNSIEPTFVNPIPLSAEDSVARPYPEELVQQENERITQAQSDTVEDIPQNEKPVQVPNFTNVREETQRFSDAEWFEEVQKKIVVLAGVGGIGSNLAIILAKLNPRSIYIFDDDYVESVNIAGQFYSTEDVGTSKVEALSRSIVKYTNYSSVVALNRRYQMGEDIIGDIMICGFDSMRSRKVFFNTWKDRVMTLPEPERKKCLFMDGRLTATEFQIFCMTGEDYYYMGEYDRDWLFDDRDARDLPCSFKQTGYLAQMIGSFMVNLFVNFCANLVNPARNMSLPFMTSYKGDLMYLDFKR